MAGRSACNHSAAAALLAAELQYHRKMGSNGIAGFAAASIPRRRGASRPVAGVAIGLSISNGI
jgi:hypothetical protein